MPTIGDYCPRCAMPTYVDGICTHDDCNYPALESYNARRKREADEALAKKRRKEAQAKAAQTKPDAGGTKPEAKHGLIDWIGGVMAIFAGLYVVDYVSDTTPDPPWIKLAAGALAALLVYALRKVIVIGGTVIFFVYMFVSANG